MPFDDTNYRDPLPQPAPPPHRTGVSRRDERLLLALLLVLALAGLILPISAASFGDVVAALRGR